MDLYHFEKKINQASSVFETALRDIGDFDQSKGKRKMQDLDIKCKVCGDESSGQHYGAGKLLIKLIYRYQNTSVFYQNTYHNLSPKLRVMVVK